MRFGEWGYDRGQDEAIGMCIGPSPQPLLYECAHVLPLCSFPGHESLKSSFQRTAHLPTDGGITKSGRGAKLLDLG